MSAPEIFGPIDEMTLLRKMTSKQCITFYCIFEELCRPTKMVKPIQCQNSLKIVKNIIFFAQLFIYINNNSLDKNVSPLYFTCIPFVMFQTCILNRGCEINCPCCPSRTFVAQDKSFPVDLSVDK